MNKVLEVCEDCAFQQNYNLQRDGLFFNELI